MNREKELESALRGLRRIIEEVGCGDWRDQNGKRFKDTPEWVRAYVVLHSTAEHPELERALDSASKGPENYRSGLSDGKRIARQQCAAIMAVCGYFSRMRGPDAWLDHGSWDEYPELFACAGVDLRSFQHGTRFYAGSAPVPAAQAEADDDEATDSEADAVVRDAERYRWMREDMKNLWGDDVLAIVGESGRHFDAAIDAAMLAAKAKGES